MAKRFVSSDPTANAAIGNVDRERKHRASLEGQRRNVDKDFGDELAGLLPHERLRVLKRALTIAGTNIWGIQAQHVNQARREIIDGPQDVA